MEILIVGNGAVGLSLGVELARRGVSVAVAGGSARAGAASTAAGAMLGCFGEIVPTTFASPFGRARFELDRQAATAWPVWLASLEESQDRAPTPIVNSEGTVVIHNAVGHPAIDDAGFAAIGQALQTYSEPHESLDASDLAWLNPEPLGRPLEALHIPGERSVEPQAILSLLDRALSAAGGQLIDSDVMRIQVLPASCVIETVNGEQCRADRVVIAAGQRSQELMDSIPGAGAGVPRLVSGPGIAAILRETPEPKVRLRHVVRTPNRAFSCGLHVVPRDAGCVYVGATNAIRPDSTQVPSVRGLQFLLDCVVRQLRRELWLADIERTIVGNRPVTLDGFPLLGPSSSERVWLLTGTYRDGFHTAPVLAMLMADWLTTGLAPEDLELFRPVRPPIEPADRAAVIQQTVDHRLATGHEFAWSLPVDWPVVMEELFARFYSDLADSIHDQFTPPPEILSFVPRHPSLVEGLRQYYSYWESA